MNDRYKTHRERLRILWEMEKPKNFYTTLEHELRSGKDGGGVGIGRKGTKGRKKMGQL